MAMLDTTPQMLDATGVQEFFYTTIGKTEPAGGGCVRVYCCVEREGVLVPVFTVVMPAMSLVIAAKVAQEAGIDAFNKDALAGAMTTH